MEDTEGCSELLQLPDACLMAVLQCCADDTRSMFSAARAHSRLHQAAQEVLSSIKIDRIQQQQQIRGLLLYVSQHGQHIDSLDVGAADNRLLSFLELPSNLQLRELDLTNFTVQLQPGSGFQGVVRPGIPLKQLRLQGCVLHDSAQGLAAALALLPDLQHLSITPAQRVSSFGFPITALLGLQKLTHLELAGIIARNPDQEGPALQPLQALTRLVDMRLHVKHQQAAVYSSMMSALQHLTRLELTGEVVLEHGVLATLTQLQHLKVTLFNRANRTLRDQQGLHQRAWQQLQGQLSQLQALQQLTHLAVRCDSRREGNPPAAAFSALTASSKLQHLDISKCRLPSDAWQHVFPTGRQLPELQYLDISDVLTLPRGPAAAPEGTRLVSCCPGLQSLDMQNLQHSADCLAPVQGLSGLHILHLASCKQGEGFEAVAQLTGLRELTLSFPDSGGGLLQLTRLQQLTLLEFDFAGTALRTATCLRQQAPVDEPVWRQVLRQHLDHSDPEVVQQAAAALAE